MKGRLIIRLTLLGLVFVIFCAKDNSIAAISNDEIGRKAICPVTKEEFKITKNTRFVDYQGKRYYFCCPGCDKQFLKNPEKYVTTATPDTLQTQTEFTEKEISYWTCSMHPSVKTDKPGKCPICGMELIPIYKSSENQITISEEKVAVLKIRSVPVEKRTIIKKIQVPAKVVKDEELYIAQQELISAQTGNRELLNSVILKLRLMGFPDNEINRMIEGKSYDESLILPSHHRAWLIADISEQDIGQIKSGQMARVKFPTYPEKEFSGKIIAVEPQVNPMTRRARARLLLEHPMVSLYTDMYAYVTIEISTGRNLSIPYSSVIDTGKRKVVYVEVKPGVYELREVKTGNETDDYVQITDGLKENELVVAEGNFFLDSQTTLAGGQSLLYGSAEEVKDATGEPTQHRH